MHEEIIKSTPESEIASTRIFNFPRDLVYRAWSEPDHLKNWWGPKGFTNTFNEFDLRPGGKWSLVMHGPEKGNYINESAFLIVNKPNRIAWKRFSQPLFHVDVTFEEIDLQKTKIVFKMLFKSAEERNKLIKFVPDKNEENFDKLEIELAKMSDQ